MFTTKKVACEANAIGFLFAGACESRFSYAHHLRKIIMLMEHMAHICKGQCLCEVFAFALN